MASEAAKAANKDVDVARGRVLSLIESRRQPAVAASLALKAFADRPSLETAAAYEVALRVLREEEAKLTAALEDRTAKIAVLKTVDLVD